MMRKTASSIGSNVIAVAYHLGGAMLLFGQVLREIAKAPFYFFLLVEQLYWIGVKSVGLVSVTALSTGMVMALQFGLGLGKFGGKLYVPKLVSDSIMREMGPVFCSIMLAARVGAGIASELASMTVTQQVDAMRALGTSPIKRLVIPRVLGCLIALPLLVAFADIVGIAGSIGIETWELGLDPMFCYEKIRATITVTEIFIGLGKTFFFAIFISLTACYFGLNVKGGTQGVGTTTTRSVVVSSILILVGDFFLTKSLYFLFER